MGGFFSKFEHIQQAVNRIPSNGRLFAFFLLDNRSSNEDLFNILENNKHWIDELSASSKIFTFMPFSKWTQQENDPGFMQMELYFRPEQFEDFYSTLEEHGKKRKDLFEDDKEEEEKNLWDSNLETNPSKFTTADEEQGFFDAFNKNEFKVNLSLAIASKFGINPENLPGILIFFEQLPMSVAEESIFIHIPADVFVDEKEFEAKLTEIYTTIQESWKFENSPKNVYSKIKYALKSKNDTTSISKAILNFDEVFSQDVEERSTSYRSFGTSEYLTDKERKGIKIFISYAREDNNFAEFLYNRLSEAGFEPWIDTKSINPGELWENAIEKALRESMFFIACLSNKSVEKRGYLQKEFKYALEKSKEFLESDIYILPIRIDNCEIPSILNKFQWIDFNPNLSLKTVDTGAGWERIMRSLTEGVRRRN